MDVGVTVVEAEEVAAAIQTSRDQSSHEDSESSVSTEPGRRLLCDMAVCSDSQLQTKPSTASDCKPAAATEQEIESSLRLSLSTPLENHITSVSSSRQRSEFGGILLYE